MSETVKADQQENNSIDANPNKFWPDRANWTLSSFSTSSATALIFCLFGIGFSCFLLNLLLTKIAVLETARCYIL